MPLYRCALMALLALAPLRASEYRGRVMFGGVPVPGATVIATRGGQKAVVTTDQQGVYSFPNLGDGKWSVEVEMQCFASQKRDVFVGSQNTVAQWDLTLLPMSRILVSAGPPHAVVESAAAPAPAAQLPDTRGSENTAPTRDETPQSASDLTERAADGFLINGSANNAANSLFGLDAAFGNFRKGPGSLYNGSIGVIVDNSALDARPFSLTGQNTPVSAYNRLTGLVSFGGPLKIPHLFTNGPNVMVNYQWTRNRNATTASGLMPTEAERNGDFSQALGPQGQPVSVIDPTTGQPFPGNRIPLSQISPQARALLNLYPLPNFDGGSRYNYQVPLIAGVHQDSLQSRAEKTLGRRNQLFGNFTYQSTRDDNPNLFDFLDTTDTTGINTSINWRRAFAPRFYGIAGFQFSRLVERTTPYFANHANVSGDAGIAGNDQDPAYWGPPTLSFASGISGLSDGQASFTHNQTGALSYASTWNRERHYVSFGADYRRQQFNVLAEQDPRGTFAFTGASTGFDFADFLLGIPDASSIAFGNADKYFRAASYDAYVTDDWRINPDFTLNAGVRWEYGSPITEVYGRLVNLDVAPGFSAVAPVVASDPVGSLTGQKYPDSLVNPDKHAFEPRIGLSWRPFAASSTVLRAGYGVYYNTSVYQTIAMQMAQQAPLSKSLSVSNSAANPLGLANGFQIAPGVSPDIFGIDPQFRVGYAQNWQVSMQRDLPGALGLTVTYLGIKGTRGMEEFLPNTYPLGAASPCPSCPTGFVYLTSNGNSTREAGEIQIRRRLHNGLAGILQYTYSKSIDDSALGGRGQAVDVIAQNWLDLAAERGLSSFDQRHSLSLTMQCSTGMGIGGGTLVSGWRGALLKEWTFLTQITAGSGLPLTPIYFAAVSGTGVTGSIRPDYTGASIYNAPPGLALNPAAYTAPMPGQWGDAGRDSIPGPMQFDLDASMGRAFQVSDHCTLDLRIDATNALNHVTFPSWDTNITSAQFGLPLSANAMRSVRTSVRLRF
jgi:Carboxypeptidase regulatory-like domain